QAVARGASAASSKPRKFVYVFVDQTVVIYDIGNGRRQVDTISLPQLRGIRGVAGNSGTHMLFVSYGPDSDAGNGHLLKFDLVARHVVWDRVYPFGIDRLGISQDGARNYTPSGELPTGAAW